MEFYLTISVLANVILLGVGLKYKWDAEFYQKSYLELANYLNHQRVERRNKRE